MSDPANRSRMQEASHWFTVMTRPSVTPGDLRRFRTWRRLPANAAALEQVRKAWVAAGALAEQPDIAAATDAVLAKYPAAGGGARVGGTRRFVLTPVTLGLAGVLVAGGGAAVVWRLTAQQYATGVGEQRLEVLADGSRLRLNTDSRVRIDFRPDERRVILQHGQAYFEVAHDAARPFVVEAAGTQVRALGTRFDVRHDGAPVRVTLLQGRVEVRGRRGPAAVLTPGETVVSDQGGVSRPVAVDAPAVASWTTGRLTFSGAPLRDVVAELNRYSTRKVVLEAPDAVAREPVSGQFVAGDTASFVAGAASLYGLRVVGETAREIRLAPE